MTTIPRLIESWQRLLGPVADQLARETGCVRRQRKLSGAKLVQLLVFGWLQHPQASLEQLTRMGARRGVWLRAQALAKRFTAPAAAFFQRLLGQVASEIVRAPQPVAVELLNRFSEVWLLDTTQVTLPAELAEQWPATGGSTAATRPAGLKLEAGLELRYGQLVGPGLLAGRTHDGEGAWAQRSLAPGSLRVTDLGYFDLADLAARSARHEYWLSRLRLDVQVYDRAGQRLELSAYARQLQRAGHEQGECAVELGARQRCPTRLLVWRVPEAVAAQRRRRLHRAAQKQGRQPSQRTLNLCAWTWLVTNAPLSVLSVAEAQALYGARWQVELLFKLWKQHFHLEHCNSTQPWRILCEIYVKLLGVLFQHRLMLLGCWHRPERSLVKAAQAIAEAASHFASVFDDRVQLSALIESINQWLDFGCRQNRRRKHPNTYLTLQQGRPVWA